MISNRIIISPKAYLLDGDIESNKEKYPDLFSRTPNLYDYSFQHGVLGRGSIVIAHNEAGRFSKFEPNSLILSQLNNHQSIAIETGLDLEKLRFALTYFSKIIFPRPSCGTDFTYRLKEFDVLKKEQIIETPIVEIPKVGFTIGQTFEKCYVNTPIIPGINVFAQDIHSNSVGYKHKYDTLLLTLYNSLPVPSVDVEIEDIISFKEKRSDEFDSFQFKLAEIEILINRNASFDEIQKKLNSLYKSLEIVDKVMLESKIKRILSSRTIEIKAPNFLNLFVGITSGVAVDLITTGGVGLISLAASTIISFLDFPHKMPKNIDERYKYVLDLREHFKIQKRHVTRNIKDWEESSKHEHFERK